MTLVHSLRTMPITRLVAVIVASVLVVAMLPFGWLVAREWSASNGAGVALDAFESYRATLLVMEKVSAERGPTNGALGEDLPISSARKESLVNARAESDRRITHLLGVLDRGACPGDCAREANRIQLMRADLERGRAVVDELLTLPLAKREPAAIMRAVDGMIAIIPELAPPLDDISLAVLRGSPETLNWVVTTRLLADFREYAGQLGSQFTAALAARRPLTTDELLAIERVRGRVVELHALIQNRLTGNPQPEVVRAALERMEREYCGTGIGYANRVRALSMRGAATDISPAKFAAEYVPPMRSITALRDVLLDLSQSDLQARHTKALIRLLGTVLAATAIAVALVTILSIVKKRVVEPLQRAAQMIEAIAGGDLSADVPATAYNVEVAKLLDSIAMLNASRIEKMRLETVRDRLLIEMKRLSETDSLTGLPNRRSLEKKAKVQWCLANLDEPDYAVIAFDLDHFKRVNDTYGHTGGDNALRMVAQLCRQTLRATDIVARVGGEEFVALMRVRGYKQAVAAAERMRATIGEATIAADDGRAFAVTASFGIAWERGPAAPDLTRLMKRADQQLYRAKDAGRNCVIAEQTESASL